MAEVEWKADVYHRISEPQFQWGLKVIERLTLGGDETVIDAGCGTGRLTALLAERLPRGRVIAVDASERMLEVAKNELARFGERIRFVKADLSELAIEAEADGVFSTATFHWVLDHDAMFAALFRALKPGGFLEAQCGGTQNLDRLHNRAFELMQRPEYEPHFRDWKNPWNFATPELTCGRLERAGFADAKAWLELAPTPFEDRQSFELFVASVVLRVHLASLPDRMKTKFVSELADLAARDEPPFVLDYVRLNMSANRT